MTIPTNTKNTSKPYKRELFEVYILWRSMQGFMGQISAQKAVKSFGKCNSDIGVIFSIKNQSEFAKKYKIENSTLTNWNKLIDRKDLLKDVLEPAKRLTQKVIFSLYKNIEENGNAEEVRLWFQYVEGWIYKADNSIPEKELTVATIHY